MGFKKWFHYRRGLKTSPGVQNRAFLGDGSANPIWDMMGGGVLNRRQLVTTGALVVEPYRVPIQPNPRSAHSPITYGAIQNPMKNKGVSGNDD